MLLLRIMGFFELEVLPLPAIYIRIGKWERFYNVHGYPV